MAAFAGESAREFLMGYYNWRAAYCDDIDIMGNRHPVSYFREIVYDLSNQPYITVQRPEYYGKQPNRSDSISSWTWTGSEENDFKKIRYCICAGGTESNCI